MHQPVISPQETPKACLVFTVESGGGRGRKLATKEGGRKGGRERKGKGKGKEGEREGRKKEERGKGREDRLDKVD